MKPGLLNLRIIQRVVTPDIRSNRDIIIREISDCPENEWIIFPEAILSGYYPDREIYTSGLNPVVIDTFLKEIEDQVRQRKCHCLIGSATLTGGGWRNTVHIFTHSAPACRHEKIKLSAPDKKHFTAGNSLVCHSIQKIPFGVLACRELIFPELWSDLKRAGAQIIFHINNAVQPQDALWRHLLIARAIENSVFVVSVNNAAPPQSLPSFVISPRGKILAESTIQEEKSIRVTIHPDEVIKDLNKREDY